MTGCEPTEVRKDEIGLFKNLRELYERIEALEKYQNDLSDDLAQLIADNILLKQERDKGVERLKKLEELTQYLHRTEWDNYHYLLNERDRLINSVCNLQEKPGVFIGSNSGVCENPNPNWKGETEKTVSVYEDESLLTPYGKLLKFVKRVAARECNGISPCYRCAARSVLTNIGEADDWIIKDE